MAVTSGSGNNAFKEWVKQYVDQQISSMGGV